jgi:hypothetical protein
MENGNRELAAIDRKMNVLINLLYKIAERDEAQTADSKIIFLHQGGLANSDIVGITGKTENYVSKRISMFNARQREQG